MRRKKFIVPLCILIATAIAFLVLQPKVSSLLFSQKRDSLLNQFITKAQAEGKVSIKAYWEFREFYSPGTFIYEPQGLPKENTSEILTKAHLPDPLVDFTPLLFFKSSHLTSIGGVIKESTLPKVESFSPRKIHLSFQDSLLYTTKTGEIVLVMLKPMDEVLRANGFVQKEKDLLTSGNMWLEIAVID